MLKNDFFLWGEKYFYAPDLFQISLAILLLPFSFIYFCVVCLNKFFAKPENFGIPIISVGNLTLGGNGKTPLTMAIFNEFSPKFKTFIILRGYARKSKGLVLVAKDGEILCDIDKSGDEAMLFATKLKNSNVIVSENRKIAINYAKNLGAKLILLDDGFSKFDILKFDILLRPNIAPKLNFILPSGAWRYPEFFYRYADFIPNQNDIKYNSKIINETPKMVLITAIAKPNRLSEFFNKTAAQVFFRDHYEFNEKELEKIVQKYGATSILTTEKDFVKMQNFKFKFSIILQDTKISENFKTELQQYISQNLIK